MGGGSEEDDGGRHQHGHRWGPTSITDSGEDSMVDDRLIDKEEEELGRISDRPAAFMVAAALGGRWAKGGDGLEPTVERSSGGLGTGDDGELWEEVQAVGRWGAGDLGNEGGLGQPALGSDGISERKKGGGPAAASVARRKRHGSTDRRGGRRLTAMVDRASRRRWEEEIGEWQTRRRKEEERGRGPTAPGGGGMRIGSGDVKWRVGSRCFGRRSVVC